MTQQFTQKQIKTRTALLIFIKSSAAPIVLYLENPQEAYEDVKKLMKTAAGAFEQETTGPIKKVCITANQIAGVALQEEQYV